MAYSTTNVVKVVNTLIGGKLADDAMVFGVLCRGCGSGVIEKNGELIRFANSCSAHPAKNTKYRRGVVVGKSNIRRYLQYLTRAHIELPGVPCEDFLSKSFAHLRLQFVE
jgi:hypothetical protein